MNTADWKLLNAEEFAQLKDKIILAYIKFLETNVVEPSLCVQEMKV